ncbi:acyl-CoA dehydrogenase [Nesterenkonia lutea]|uniref:Alkylation response protein AidB-like acyl-CoA dehydrogenase n=1 Tax=Nesterenkonia lutea TaxID=272919 RepID=A0ABR9JHQ5_9MICC|nr:acyl-CoA dehydrogenase [Nesterenkonia lutea]MBE1525452.1 alkylation response protein AidB-like acyl-CoA dehydrogenase [Nesterenkonia lutea]
MTLHHPDLHTDAAPGYPELHERYAEVFHRIAQGALEREQGRILPFEQVEWLRHAGFGALRVPRHLGGEGVPAQTLFRLLIDLAQSDPHVAHLWRGHFAFLEAHLSSGDSAERAFWSNQAVEHRAIIGNAQSEQGIESWEKQTTTLSRHADGTLRLDGKKYYSTGTLFADWVNVTTRYGEEFASFPVRTDAPGLVRIDDWDGFGQRLTGTGTTTFDQVPVEEAHLTVHAADQRPITHMIGFYQLHLLAVLAGIGRRAVDDIVTHIQSSTRRPLGAPAGVTPASDPLNQAVIGRASAKVKAVQASVLDAAADLERAWQARHGAEGAEAAEAAADRANLSVYQAQVVAIPLVLEATTSIFDATGASSTSVSKLLDRHWRNARTISSHNPLPRKEQWVGGYELLGTLSYPWQLLDSHAAGEPERAA